MLKKSWIVLMTLMLVISMLAACGTSSNTPGTEANQGTTEEKPTEQTEKTKDPVTIKVYNYLTDVEVEKMQPLIANFEAENKDIKVELVPLVPGNSLESLTKLDVSIASGEQVDVAFLPSVEETMSRAALGVLAPLDELYAKDGINPEEEYYINPKYNGKYYAMMNQSTHWLVMINEEALKAANLSAPSFDWTWDDFREYAKAMTKGEGADKQYGAYFHNWGEFANMIAYTDLKNPYLTEQLTPVFEDPSFKQFFEMRRAMEKEDKSAKPFADVIGAKLNYRTEFFNGKAAMLLIGSFGLNSVGNKTEYPHTFKTVIAPVPRSSESAEPGLTNIGGNFVSIAANSKHKEEAFRFIRYMSTDVNDRPWLSGWKKLDANALVDRLYGQDKDLLDLESLKTTLYDSKVKTSLSTDIAVPYAAQLKKVLEDGFSKYILDNTTAEDAQKWMVEEANKIIKQNTK